MALDGRLRRLEATQLDTDELFRFVVSPERLPRGHRCDDRCEHFSFEIDAPRACWAGDDGQP